MQHVNTYQESLGSTVATFQQNGTYSNVVDLSGMALVGVVGTPWAGAAGTLIVRNAHTSSGTGAPMLHDGTFVRVDGFVGGTVYTLSPLRTLAAQFVVLEIGTAGTIASGGGSVLLFGRPL